jgi:hypothetical protein
MAEGEVTSRQDGGVQTWDVDAAAVGDGMTRSVVRRSYLRLRARPTGSGPPYVPVATRRSIGRGPCCAVSAGGLRDAQYRPDRPIADGLGAWPTCCAVSTLLIHRHEAVNAQCRSVAYVVAKA